MPTKQENIRLPELTQQQLTQLVEELGMTKTQVVIIAIDRLYQQELSKQLTTKTEPES